MLSGPDVSEYQGDVDWKKVARRHELAIVRISDGDYRDPWYTAARLKAIEKAGLLFGPYYFARVASPHNKERNGAAEARMAIGFARKAGWRGPSKGQLPLIYDFETNNGQPHEKCAKHVIQFVRAYRERTKHHPGIYTMPGFWSLILPYLTKPNRRLIARCFLHQAEWEVAGPPRARTVGWRHDLAVHRDWPLPGNLGQLRSKSHRRCRFSPGIAPRLTTRPSAVRRNPATSRATPPTSRPSDIQLMPD